MTKIMKKTALFTTLICGFGLLASTQSFGAQLSTQTDAGNTVTLADNTGNGPGLSFNPSPNIFLVSVSTDVNYVVQTMNNNVADGSRNEYAIWNGNTGYYMQSNPDMAGTTVAVTDFTIDLAANTDITSSPYTAWANYGGGGS